MARGNNFEGSYSLGPEIKEASSSNTPIAAAILGANNVPFTNVTGSPLSGYDIKSQDSTTMIRLSLLAQGFGEGGDENFREIYVGPDGLARTVIVGQSTSAEPKKLILTSEVSSYVNKINHVLVKGKDPLPARKNGPTVSVMGAGVPSNWGNINCPIGYFTKGSALGQEAWAAFETSPQHPDMQKKLKQMVKRSKWEQLVGYKHTIANIPSYASFSVSQTTPYIENISSSLTSDLNDTVAKVTINSDPYEGGIIDISSVNIVGSPVLDIMDGETLKNSFSAFINESSTTYKFTKDDYYVLLDHQCGLQKMSRGENWFVYPNGDLNSAAIILKESQGSKDIWDIYKGAFNTVNYFRRANGQISSISDMVKSNIELGSDPLSQDLSDVAYNENMTGKIIPGFGGRFGIESFDAHIAYTIAKPSIAIRSPFGDAFNIAAAVAAAGVQATAIVILDKPAPTGWNGTLVYPPPPPDDEADIVEVDSPIDNLTGSIVDLSAPFLGEEGVVKFSSLLHSLINGDSGKYKSYNYVMGGYGLLPGMKFKDSVIHTIEFNYADKDSVSTNITTGPLYYNVGSYGDSQYVKRAETITRNGRVLAGSNSTGTFTVHVDGLGTYEALNSLIEPCFPGDKVEVKVMNVPVEK